MSAIARVALGIGIFTMASAALAEPRPGPPPPLHRVLIEQADELGITAEQTAQIEALADANEASGRAAHDSMQAAQASGDAAAIQAARTELDALRATMEDGFGSIFGAERWAEIQAELPPPPPPPVESRR